MTPLFFYGTLRHLPLLEIVLGKPLDQIAAMPAQLPGYAVYGVQEGPFPTIMPDEDAQSAGVILHNLTPEDVARLDFYEGGFDYDLTTATLADGQELQFYMSPKGRWTPKELWDLTAWEDQWAEMNNHAAREVMGYFGVKTGQEVMASYDPIRTRAWAKVLAQDGHHGAGLLNGDVKLSDHTTPYLGFFAVDELTLQHQRFDGSTSPKLPRSALLATDAALVLPYDPVRDRVMMVEQVRIGPILRHDPCKWQLEPVAGRIDPGEKPETAARREALEEANITLDLLELVAQMYPSPGTSTEFYHIYVGLTDLPDGIEGTGGLQAEDEDIRSHVVTLDVLLEMCDRQEVANAALITTAYWLARHRDRLRS